VDSPFAGYALPDFLSRLADRSILPVIEHNVMFDIGMLLSVPGGLLPR